MQDASQTTHGYSKWQRLDLKDGAGKQWVHIRRSSRRRTLLLVITSEHALQIFRLPSGNPVGPLAGEVTLAPEEVFTVANFGATAAGPGVVLSAQVVVEGDMADEHGPVILAV
jgi:hypothetical protein